jgi:hypothetical protein
VAKLSEKKRLLLTIGVTVALTGGLTALIFSDRGEIEGLQSEIEELDARIAAADVEIRKTREREDKVVVFRAVEARELAVLPDQQKIADFYRNLGKFFAAAGLKFRELPESQAVESDLAKGIFVTRNQVECQGDSPSLLKFLNMVENDPRLVSIKGLKVDGADTRNRRTADKEGPLLHDITVHLESYFYNPANLGFKPVSIPSEEQRLQEPSVKDAIAAFQPERPDTYVLRPSASRRDPLVDPRQRREKVDEDAEATEFKRQEKVVDEVEASHRDINELQEQLKALVLGGELFKADRLQAEIDGKVNELRGRLAQVSQMKTITNPTLSARVQAVQERVDEFLGRRVPRETTVTRSVAEKTLAELKEYFAKREYTEVATLGSAWADYLKGKEVDADARPLLAEIVTMRARARILAEAETIPISITGTIVDERDPARSMAMVNGARLHPGDPVDEKKEVQVFRVLRTGVEFKYQDEIFFRDRNTGNLGKPKTPPGQKPGSAGKAATVKPSVKPAVKPTR